MFFLKNLVVAIIVLSFVSLGTAQEKTADPETRDEIKQLRIKFEEQQKLLDLLKETVEKQAKIIEQQQKQLAVVESKFEPAKNESPVAANQANQPAAIQNKTAAATPSPSPKLSDFMESGFGKVKFDGLFQAWYSAGTDTNNTLRFRRTELKFTGQINPDVKWTIMIDPAKTLSLSQTTTMINGIPVLTSVSPNQSSRMLQDGFITLNYLKNVNVDIGQFKIPLTFEGLQSSATLDTVERALFMSDRARGGGLGDIRDFGIQFSGPLGKSINYQMGIFNGTGENQNISDANQEKAVIGRFVVRPSFIKGLQIGGSGAWSNSNAPKNPRRDRAGGELVYSNGRFKLKAEVMGAVDGDLHRLGYYTHFGYRATPKVELVFRVDGFDPDRRLETNSSNVRELDYVSGFNYYITENRFKFQFNYVRKTFNDGIKPSRNLFLANIQTSW